MNAINPHKVIAEAPEPRSDIVEQEIVKIFLVSYVPRALQDRSVNIAVVMVGNGFADARFARNWQAVLAVDPDADTELLTQLTREIWDKLQVLDKREEMLLQMQDSWSNTVQISVGKGCLTKDPVTEIEILALQYL